METKRMRRLCMPHPFTHMIINTQPSVSNQMTDKFTILLQAHIIKKSLFDFKTDKKFDIVASLGVIHHTQNKERAFRHKASFLKDGGFMIGSL